MRKFEWMNGMRKKGFGAKWLGLILLTLGGQVWAGPPFLTDDPDPVDFQHWEFYVAGNYLQTSMGSAGTGQIEVNYGAFPEVQLHTIITGTFNAPNGQTTTSGTGDTEVGIKYRFLKADDDTLHVTTFPIVELPTGNASQGLGSGQLQLYLPLWIQKTWGPWTTYGGGGYWVNPGAGNQDWVFLGWEAQRELSKTFTLGGELFFKTPAIAGGLDSLGFNLGLIVDRDEHNHFMLSLGRDIVNPVNVLLGYAAYQWTF